MNSKTFPTLYTIDALGDKRQWSIEVQDNKIKTSFGFFESYMNISGKMIEEGKQGRNAHEQAVFEAESLYKKKIDSGYTTNRTGIPEPDAPLPMLAKQFKDRKHLIEYPVIVQPKLDGFRCITIKKKGVISCWSRKGKKFETTEHIEDELNSVMQEGEIYDGELYNHELSFNYIASSVKNIANKDNVGFFYYIYDLISPKVQAFRVDDLRKKFLNELENKLWIKEVPFQIAHSELEVNRITSQHIKDGYEGSIVRLPWGEYRPKHRSSEMLKVKNFQDDEFLIIGFKDGTGKEEGAVIWECETKDKETFFCRPEGTYVFRQAIFPEADRYVGKYLTVRYFELSEKGIPRFPVGVRIREDI